MRTFHDFPAYALNYASTAAMASGASGPMVARS
ncbi:protein of unknown function [Methylocella tundrae]|uniref:Uncharacterized protein n=1 Tax=Methylocella tundrae TaxID=227605 RepID=A0A4U8YVV7_METTU|nr:protein of unknown function [Methylocella tundrae]